MSLTLVATTREAGRAARELEIHRIQGAPRRADELTGDVIDALAAVA